METKHGIIMGVTASALAVVMIFVPKVRETVGGFFETFKDRSPFPLEAVDFVIDNTEGSTGTEKNVSVMLDKWLPWIARAPGSGLRIICQGQQGTTASIVFETQSTPPPQNSDRARRAHILRYVQVTKELALKAVAPCFVAVNQQQSPIAETIAWTALQSPPANLSSTITRRIIIITDARQVSKLADFECDHQLPTTVDFTKRLQASRILAPGSLQDMRLAFVFVETRPINRAGCPPMTIERMIQIRELWTHACTQAGAAEVLFRTSALIPEEGISSKENP